MGHVLMSMEFDIYVTRVLVPVPLSPVLSAQGVFGNDLGGGRLTGI